MNATIPTWTRDFVTATTETDQGETITRYTGWRAVLDPSYMQRYRTWGEWELDIVADDQGHDCGCLGCATVHGSDCASNAAILCGMSVPDCSEADVLAAANTALAEQGFRIDGPWVSGPNGTLTAPLVPVILDPNCAAYEPESAAKLSATFGAGDIVHVAKWGDAKFRVLDTFPQYEGGRRLELVHVASLSGNLSGHVDPSELSRVAV